MDKHEILNAMRQRLLVGIVLAIDHIIRHGTLVIATNKKVTMKLEQLPLR